MSLVYLDNQSTTRVDDRVIEAMTEFMVRQYANAGSTSHRFGQESRQAVDDAREFIAMHTGAKAKELLFTSGATESNNLAIRGLALHPRRMIAKGQAVGKHIVSVATEHKAVLDPLARLEREGYEVTYLQPQQSDEAAPGLISAEQVAAALREDTFLVVVMLANNEIGVIQPLAEIGALCRKREVFLFTDATQALGQFPVNFRELNVDLASFSAHKMYGPKGVGALYVRQGAPRVRLVPLVDGGGQELGMRSGTLNVPGIVGFAKAFGLSVEAMLQGDDQVRSLRDEFWKRLQSEVPAIQLNGPPLSSRSLRLLGNLNEHFPGIDGEALMMQMPEVAVSSGSACTSASPEPSHVLQAIGLTADQARSSLRISFGRFNTPAEIDIVVPQMVAAVQKLEAL